MVMLHVTTPPFSCAICVCVCVFSHYRLRHIWRCSQLFSGKNILVKFREFVAYPYIKLLNMLNLQFSIGKPIYVGKCVC